MPVPAGVVVRGEPASVDPRAASLDGDDALGGAGQQLAIMADEEHRLAGLGQLPLQPALAGDVEVVVRLVEQEHLVGAAQQRLEHQPLLLAAGQRGHSAPLGPDPGAPKASVQQVSQSTSASYPPASAQSASACAYASWVGSSSRSIMATSAASTAWAAARIRAGATESSRSRTVLSSRTLPTNCRITPRPPLLTTAPDVGARSPAAIRSNVVLPAPLAPTRATTAPSPTRNDTSSSSTRPSGSVQPTALTSRCPTAGHLGPRGIA